MFFSWGGTNESLVSQIATLPAKAPGSWQLAKKGLLLEASLGLQININEKYNDAACHVQSH